MNEILNKIASYNLLNYLLPGAVFSVVADQLGLLSTPDEIIEKLVWFCFSGVIVSRLGSLVLEPIFKKLAFVRYSDYADYLETCQIDRKIEVIIEEANTYRTLAVAFLA